MSRHPCASRVPFIQALKKLFQLLFLIFAGLHLVGGPYAIVQVCAWGKMLASYSQESGLVQGARDTFSGEKPCPICCKIAAAKKADAEHGKPQDAPAPVMPVAKVPEFLATAHDFIPPLAATDLPPVSFVRPLSLHGIPAHSPPAPPPRLVA